MGATLFDRSTHNVVLTAAGEQLLLAAEEILRQFETTRKSAQSAAKAASDTVRFAVTHALVLTFFPAWLRSFETVAPMAPALRLTADNRVACERLMIEGRAHFLLCHDHPASTTCLTEKAFASITLGHDTLTTMPCPHAEVSAAAKGR